MALMYDDEHVQIIMRILLEAGEPISNREMEALAKEILGDKWKRSWQITNSCIRTALCTLGVVSHPRRGMWGLEPQAEERLRALAGADIWAEHIRIRDAKRARVAESLADAPEPDIDDVLDLTKSLVETWGPSGYEHRIRDLIREEVADLCDETRVDGLGNLICRIGQRRDKSADRRAHGRDRLDGELPGA